MKQALMFAAADLPLFSGTAPRANVRPFVPREIERQDPLPGLDAGSHMTVNLIPDTKRRIAAAEAEHNWRLVRQLLRRLAELQTEQETRRHNENL